MDINFNLLTTKELINIGKGLNLNIDDINKLTEVISDNYEYYIKNYNINELEDLNKAYNLYKNGYILQQGCCYNVTPINYLGEDNKNMIDLLWDIPNVQNLDGEEMRGETFKMTKEGLTCMSCLNADGEL